jgi:hypothetical protein
MPKLIRLQGDSSESNTEIHNTFREPIIVQPNSKVALIGISATMAQDLGNSLFEITGSTDGRFTIAPQAIPVLYVAEAQLDVGVWTLSQLRVKFEEAANFSLSSVDVDSAVATIYQGLDHQIIYDDKFNILTHQSSLEYTNFQTEWTQDVNATLINSPLYDGFDASGGIVGIRQATKIVPRVYSTLQATLKNPDTILHSIYAAKTATSSATFGVNAQNGTYNYVENGISHGIVDDNGLVPASSGDKVTISKYGGSLLILLEDSYGAPIGTGFNAGPGEYLYENVFNKTQNNEILHWSIIVENGGGVSDVETTSISNHYSGLATSVDDYPVQAFIGFYYQSGFDVIDNPTLSTYMGFSGDTNIILYEGLPAKLRAPEQPQGLSENAGVVVAIDGLGKLDSHDGSAFSRSMSNMIYVLNTPDTLGQLLQLDVAAPFYLNMNNKFPINVNELRIRFLAFAGGSVLKFIGKPSLTILIDSS